MQASVFPHVCSKKKNLQPCHASVMELFVERANGFFSVDSSLQNSHQRCLTRLLIPL